MKAEGADLLVRASNLLEEMRSEYDQWSQLVDEILEVDPDRVPGPELRAWREAAGHWLEAQEGITSEMIECDDELRCMQLVSPSMNMAFTRRKFPPPEFRRWES